MAGGEKLRELILHLAVKCEPDSRFGLGEAQPTAACN